MAKKRIDVTMLIDRSGSTGDCPDGGNVTFAKLMENAIDDFIKDQQKYDDSCLTVYTFHSTGTFQNEFLEKEFKDITEPIKIIPAHMTALIDAWCLVIDETGKRLSAKAEHERPNEVLLIIVTDGKENDSREFSEEQLKKRIELQENTYNWKFSYFGANQVAKDVATKFGITRGQTMSYTPDKNGTYAASTAFCQTMSSIRTDSYVAKDINQEDILKSTES
jgi:hypothetical protein